MKIRIKGKCKCNHLHIDKLYFGQIGVSMQEEKSDRGGNEFCCLYTDIMINGEKAETKMSLLQGREMTALKTRCEKSEHNDCNGERNLDFSDHLELELKELVF